MQQGVAHLADQLAGGAAHLPAHVDRLGKRFRANGHGQEVLELQRVVRQHPPADDADLRHRQRVGPRRIQIPEERQPCIHRGRPRAGQRHPQDGVGPEPGQIRRAVDLPQQLVDLGLLRSILTYERGRDDLLHIVDSLEDSLPAIP